MQNRYKISREFSTKTEENKSEKTTKRLESYIIPQVEFSADDVYIYARQGDRLDNLAYRYYNDQSLWWVIAKANNIGKGTWFVNPGILLRIPKISSGFNLLEELEIYQREYR
jgi:nucleoid-associated protein YgaU